VNILSTGIPTFLILAVALFSGCDEAPTSVGSSEPYSIKVNDTLGIRLGMPYDDFTALHRPKSTKHTKQTKFDDPICTDDVDEEVFCTISIDYDNQPKIGDVRVVFYTLTFYQKHLIVIDYSLESLDWETFMGGLNDKFGKSQKRASGLAWENSVSDVLFTKSESDFTTAHLNLALSKEKHDWLERSRERQKEETKKSL
jgi:hypothetical protein